MSHGLISQKIGDLHQTAFIVNGVYGLKHIFPPGAVPTYLAQVIACRAFYAVDKPNFGKPALTESSIHERQIAHAFSAATMFFSVTLLIIFS